jgi:hypothetical protein
LGHWRDRRRLRHHPPSGQGLDVVADSESEVEVKLVTEPFYLNVVGLDRFVILRAEEIYTTKMHERDDLRIMWPEAVADAVFMIDRMEKGKVPHGS